MKAYTWEKNGYFAKFLNGDRLQVGPGELEYLPERRRGYNYADGFVEVFTHICEGNFWAREGYISPSGLFIRAENIGDARKFVREQS